MSFFLNERRRRGVTACAALALGMAVAACTISTAHSGEPPGSASAGASRTGEPQPQPGVDFVIEKFDRYPLVGIGELHFLVQGYDFLEQLIRDPRFTRKVNVIVLEAANSLYQPVIDRYTNGENVSEKELSQAWHNTSQSPTLTLDQQVILDLYRTVREVNRKLPKERRLRLLAGDTPIDWSQVHTRDDIHKFGERDALFADLVKREVMDKGKKALLWIGGVHLQRDPVNEQGGFFAAVPASGAAASGKKPGTWEAPAEGGGKSAGRMVGEAGSMIDKAYPGKLYVIDMYSGLIGVVTDEKEGISTADAPVTVDTLEAKLAKWPKPGAIELRGSWVGDLPAWLFKPGTLMFVSGSKPKYVSSRAMPIAQHKYSEMADALLFLAKRSELVHSGLVPHAFDDPDYRRELDRRSQMTFGKPFDPAWFSVEPRPYFDPNQPRAPMPQSLGGGMMPVPPPK